MAQLPDNWSVSPKFRTPKKLEKLAVDSVASLILTRSIPIVDEWLTGSVTPAALTCLKAQKIWYWNEASRWLGSPNSIIRQLLSKAFTELAYQVYYCERYKTMMGFVIQSLFCCTVGHLEVVQTEEVAIEHNILIINLLRETQPFYNTGFYDTCMNFPRALPIIEVLMASPFLKHLHLRYEGCNYALMHLERTCPGLELFRLEIEISQDSLLEPALFRAFFKNLPSDKVINNFNCKENVPISFPNLKVFQVRFDRMPFRTLPQFFGCLLQYYPNIKLQFSNLIALPYDNTDAKLPSLILSFLIEMELYEAKRIKSFMWSKNMVPWKKARKDGHSLFESSFYMLKLLCQSVRLVHEDLHRMNFQNLKLVYYNEHIASVTSTLDDSVGSVLQELHLFGTVTCTSLLDYLVEILNRCPVLKILSLFICVRDLLPLEKGLMPLKNLNVLSAFFVHYTRGFFPGELVERNIEQFMEQIIKAAPNLTVLEMQGRPSLMQLIDRGMLRTINTLSLTDWMYMTEAEFHSRLDRLIYLNTLILNGKCGYSRYEYLKRQLRKTDLDVIFKKERLVDPLLY